MLSLLPAIITSVLVSSLVVYLMAKNKADVLQHENKRLQQETIHFIQQLEKSTAQQEHLRLSLNSLELQKKEFEIQNQTLKQQLERLTSEQDVQLQRFEAMANKILQYQTSSMEEKQKLGMKEILVPLQQKIKEFEEKIEKNNIITAERHASLKEEIKGLSEKSDIVSREANNLVKALKGDYKKQGNWGELILERILEKSGLEKDREYFVQVTERNVEGKVHKPDVVIQLPDGKKLIVDSKVSLIAYENMVNSTDEQAQQEFHKAHMLAVKTHIDNLSSKNYHDLYSVESPDFVLMFIPIDTALSSVLQQNPELYTYAFDKNIVMVSPSTLLATLKTVHTMWRNDKQNRFAVEIAEEAGKMYDKFVGFYEDMEKLGKQLHTVQGTYTDTMKKLHTGSGNLINRAEHIKSLGAKANKALPKSSLLDE